MPLNWENSARNSSWPLSLRQPPGGGQYHCTREHDAALAGMLFPDVVGRPEAGHGVGHRIAWGDDLQRCPVRRALSPRTSESLPADK